MNVTRWVDQVKWAALRIAFAIGSLTAPACGELRQNPGRVLKIRRALPLRSLLLVTMRLPSLFASN